MSEHDAALYAKLRGQVQRSIQSIRVMLDSLQVSVAMVHGGQGGGGGGGAGGGGVGGGVSG